MTRVLLMTVSGYTVTEVVGVKVEDLIILLVVTTILMLVDVARIVVAVVTVGLGMMHLQAAVVCIALVAARQAGFTELAACRFSIGCASSWRRARRRPSTSPTAGALAEVVLVTPGRVLVLTNW